MVSDRWSNEDLASRIASNPSLRIAREQGPKPARPSIEVLARAMTEAELQENIRQMAVLHKWRYFHAWTSVHSPSGFPDLLLIRFTRENTCGGQKIYARLLVIELKREGKSPTPVQQEWLEDFKMLGLCVESLTRPRRGRSSIPQDTTVAIESYCWHPTQWLDGTIEKVLA